MADAKKQLLKDAIAYRRRAQAAERQRDALADELAAEKKACKKAEGQRQYYKSVVYDVCGWLDKMLNRHVFKGTGTVCGELAHPYDGVQKGLQEVEANLACEKKARETAETGRNLARKLYAETAQDRAKLYRGMAVLEAENVRLRNGLEAARHDLAVEWQPEDDKGRRARAAAVADADRALVGEET